MNKIVGVAGVLVQDNKILLAKRKYGSKKGKWCIPCGKVEPNEKLEEAVVREFVEETHLKTVILNKIHEVKAPHHKYGTPYEGTWFELKFISGTLQADDDAEEAEFFSYSELPEMAFTDDIYVIEEILGLG